MPNKVRDFIKFYKREDYAGIIPRFGIPLFPVKGPVLMGI